MGSLNTEFLAIPTYRKDAEACLLNVTRFLSHPELLKKQLEVIEKVLQSQHTLPLPPRVVPVSLPDITLRGWCGIESIFVNLTAFQIIPQRDFLIADLCTILAHESMHYYLRRIEGISQRLPNSVCYFGSYSTNLVRTLPCTTSR